jgi:hypothetical protein
MVSNATIGAAIAIFVVAALLYYQAHATGLEAFQDVPADLNKAPLNPSYSAALPAPAQRPAGVPGPGTAPKEALASQKDLMNLESKLTVWLDGAAQRENENAAILTPDQRQQRVVYMARVNDIRAQLGTGLLTDPYRIVAQEIKDLERQNAEWKRGAPSLDALNSFATGEPTDSFLSPELYASFRQLFLAALADLKHHAQPDPLQRVRLQQLQVLHQDLEHAERKYRPPPIRVGAAQLFLRQMLKADQPLPTLFSMESNPTTQPPSLAASPVDLINDLKDMQWKLIIQHTPGQQELRQAIAALLTRLQQPASPEEIEATRSHIAALKATQGPVAAPPAPLQYDPRDLRKRATTLCKQVREAFPQDAEALGCPRRPASDEFEAETIINTVCDRIRYSVPSVDPAQFNCPVQPV